MEVLDDAYIQYVVDAVDHNLTQHDVNLSGFLDLLATFYNAESDTAIKASVLFTVLIGAAVKAGRIPQAATQDVFSDELLTCAAGLVYADTPDAWNNIGSIVRKMLNDMVGIE